MKNKSILAIGLVLLSTQSFGAESYTRKSVGFDQSFRDYGTVTSITTQYDEINRPTEVCRKEMVRDEVYQPQAAQSEQGDSAAGVIIGGIAGGILGHQVGGGTGKDLATAAGAVTGAIVGNNLAKRNNQPQVASTPRLVEREALVCKTENKTERIVSGYNVEYTYNGRTFQTFMRDKPVGTKLPVNITVLPSN